MAFHLITSTSATGATGPNDTASTGPFNSTGAGLIVCGVSADSEIDALPEVGDNRLNVYTARQVQLFVNEQQCWPFDCSDPINGSGHTVHVDGSFLNAFMGVLVFGGGIAVFDQQSGTTGGSVTSIQPGSVTPSAADSILVTAIAIDDEHRENVGVPSNFAIDSGFTIVQSGGGSGLTFGAVAYKIRTSIAAENPTWSWDGGIFNCACVMTVYMPLSESDTPSVPRGNIGPIAWLKTSRVRP